MCKCHSVRVIEESLLGDVDPSSTARAGTAITIHAMTVWPSATVNSQSGTGHGCICHNYIGNNYIGNNYTVLFQESAAVSAPMDCRAQNSWGN